jgi:putative tryptophan/tyrosine transport system substrate-binding protein
VDEWPQCQDRVPLVGRGDVQRYRTFAAELVGQRPDALVAGGGPTLEALATQSSIPIVFAMVADQLALGYVNSLARPGDNITGFMAAPPSLGGKWLEVLKAIAPQVKRVAFVYNPQTGSYARSFFPYAETAAAAYAVNLIAVPVGSDKEVEGALETLTREPNGGLIVNGDDFTLAHRSQIFAVAARYGLPAIYSNRLYVNDGGLISYGVDYPELFRQAAGYVDRILKGEKPADLPVQAPTKYELIINLKTAPPAY